LAHLIFGPTLFGQKRHYQLKSVLDQFCQISKNNTLKIEKLRRWEITTREFIDLICKFSISINKHIVHTPLHH
jgi:hypothetical protein